VPPKSVWGYYRWGEQKVKAEDSFEKAECGGFVPVVDEEGGGQHEDRCEK
jgi:hypothetical protein